MMLLWYLDKTKIKVKTVFTLTKLKNKIYIKVIIFEVINRNNNQHLHTISLEHNLNSILNCKNSLYIV